MLKEARKIALENANQQNPELSIIIKDIINMKKNICDKKKLYHQ